MSYDKNEEHFGRNFGRINLGFESIVTDPCYEMDGYDGARFRTRPGDYEISVTIDSDDIVCGWTARHVNQTGRLPNSKVYECGVDSGQLGIFDVAAYPKGETGEFMDKGSFYGRACETTLSDKRMGILDEGFVSCTGYGDGCYPVTVYFNENGEAEIIKVEFEDPDGDEDEEEEDEGEEEEDED